MATPKETAQAKAKELGIAFTDETTVPELKKLIAEKEGGDGGGGSKKTFFYVVYVDAYKNDTEVVPRGIYRTSKKIERFENMSDRFVQSFEGKIGDKVLHKLAEELRISVENEDGDYRDSKDILEEMVQEL